MNSLCAIHHHHGHDAEIDSTAKAIIYGEKNKKKNEKKE